MSVWEELDAYQAGAALRSFHRVVASGLDAGWSAASLFRGIYWTLPPQNAAPTLKHPDAIGMQKVRWVESVAAVLVISVHLSITRGATQTGLRWTLFPLIPLNLACTDEGSMTGNTREAGVISARSIGALHEALGVPKLPE